MAFKISEHKGENFFIVIHDNDGNQVAEYELKPLSYMRWNEIGLQVVADEAPKIKDPKNPKDYIQDLATQRRLDAEAEVMRNAMRVVESLEGGEGIDWGGNEPETLLEKAEQLQAIDVLTFNALIVGLRNWTLGKGVSAESAAQRFQRLQSESNESL